MIILRRHIFNYRSLSTDIGQRQREPHFLERHWRGNVGSEHLRAPARVAVDFPRKSLFPDYREFAAALQPRFLDHLTVINALLAQILGEIVRGHMGIPQCLAVNNTVPDQRSVMAFDEKAQGRRAL